ncbi:hypothetical protein [Gaoshiqia sp. Z1-71]|uniref:hypothetical protein n=1 Tax=Gaoshiqia hydrogeniformans TaxID=3290090 RepID=UPI003BF876D6
MKSTTRFILSVLLCIVLNAEATWAQDDQADMNQPGQTKWKLSVDGGVGYRIASTKDSKQALIRQGQDPSEVNSYFDQIKWGPQFSAQLHYLFSARYGVGVDYQFHTSSGNLYGTFDPGDGVTLYYGEVKDEVFTNYLGLSFYLYQWLKTSKLAFSSQISVGPVFFRQENVTLYTPALVTGKTLGGKVGYGLEYFLSRNIALGIHLNLFYATISKVKVDYESSSDEVDLPKDQKEGLSRIDGGAGIKFYF